MCDNGLYIKIGMVIMIRLPLLPLADYDCKLHLRNKEAFWHLPTSAAPEGILLCQMQASTTVHGTQGVMV